MDSYHRSIIDEALQQIAARAAEIAQQLTPTAEQTRPSLEALRSGPLGTNLATVAAIAEGGPTSTDRNAERETIHILLTSLFRPLYGERRTPYPIPPDFYGTPSGRLITTPALASWI